MRVRVLCRVTLGQMAGDAVVLVFGMKHRVVLAEDLQGLQGIPGMGAGSDGKPFEF